MSTPPTSSLLLAGSDFTIEVWAYFNASVSGTGYFFVAHAASFASNAGFAFLRHGDTDNLRFIYTNDGTGASGYKITDSTNTFIPTTNTWYHLAVTRSGSTVRLFINGVVSGSSTQTTSIYPSTHNITIGTDAAGNYPMNGYLSDVRITKGLARYTSNFTPPTAALQG